jgi:hypothetical protein
MHQNDIQDLSQLLANTEKTIELAQYWQQRYSDLLVSGKFEISSKTKQTLTSDQIITKPATPYGNLFLSKHLDSNNNLDQVSLQSTVEIAVRLLDASLECINFDQNSKFQTAQYRKIGIGVEDIQTFLDDQGDEANIELIDRIGKIVSTAAYRASESLAMEKGVPTKWESIATHIRPKSFENWYNSTTREIKTSLEISQEYDTDSIINSGYSIIPRRNSHLLLLPVDMEWQLWSDRDESSPVTPLDTLVNPVPQVDLSPLPDISNSLPADQNDQITEIVENQIIEIAPHSHDLIEQKPQDHELEKVSKEKNEIASADTFDNTNIFEQASDIGFLQGELVRFKNDSKKYIYQVVSKIEGHNNPSRYQLYGHQIGENELVSAQDLEAVNIDEILNFTTTKKPLNISLIYLSEDGNQVLVVAENNQHNLPKVEIKEIGQDLYATISEAFTSLYGQPTEVEACTFLDTDPTSNDLYIGISAHLKDIYQNCIWLDITDLTTLSHTDYRLLELYVEHENYLHDLLEFNNELLSQNDSHQHSITTDPNSTAEIEKITTQYQQQIADLTSNHQLQLDQLKQELAVKYESQLAQLQAQHETSLKEITEEKVAKQLDQQIQKLDQTSTKELETTKKNLIQNELAKLESGETKFDLAILNHPAIQAEIDKRATQKAASIGNKLSFRASVANLKKITQHNQNS